MKKLFIIGLISLAGGMVSLGQGAMILDNGIRSPGPYITYGNAGIPANGVSGTSGNVGGFVQGSWTMGLYYALGDVTGSVASDPTGFADISTLGGGLILGTGTGSTASFAASFEPGAATADFEFLVPGTASGGGNTITVIVTAYNKHRCWQLCERSLAGAFGGVYNDYRRRRCTSSRGQFYVRIFCFHRARTIHVCPGGPE